MVMRVRLATWVAGAAVLAGCGGSSSDAPPTRQGADIPKPAPGDAGDSVHPARQGSPIKSLKTGQQVGKPMLKLEGLVAELVGKQVFLQGDRPGSKPLGVSFYTDGTWIDSVGSVGRFEVKDTTLLVTNDVNSTYPHVFPKAKVAVGDVVVVQAGGLEYRNTITEITEAVDADAARAAAAKAAEPIDEPDEIDGYQVVGFAKLASYQYKAPFDELSSPEAKAIMAQNKIPDDIKDFSGQKIAIRGYMLPLVVKNGRVTEFIIYRDQAACCFGKIPRINEWITVKMSGEGVLPLKDVPLYFFGTLKVGAVVVDDFLVGLYEMTGDKVGGPL